MTTIPEEMDEDLAFTQLLDLPNVTLPDAEEDVILGNTTADASHWSWCPDHPDSTTCACNGFLGDWDVPAPAEEIAGVEEPDYSRFENWIPKFVRPEKPCDYCRSRRLQCYMQRGEPFCTSCATLFRECSLSKSNTLEATNHRYDVNGTFLDTLGVVDENVCKERGTMTGIKPLRSKNNNAHSGTSSPVHPDDAPGSTKRNGIRFPRHAVKTLRDWLDAHADNPYPTEEEKVELEKATELKPMQIANWLANARRRRKATEKSRPRVAESPTLRPSTAAIDIPGADKPWDELNPFDRWKISPPEHEPANLADIANAVAKTKARAPDDEISASPSTLGRSSKKRKGSSDGSSYRRAPSTTSLETRQTSSLSSSSAAYSKTSSHSTHGSFGSFSSSLAGKKDRRRRRRPAVAAAGRKPSDSGKRIFQCTFCTDTFKSKYDWTRHEKSLHLSLEKWICAPLGPIITNQETGDKQCVYCDLHNPSSDHIESHNHRQCEDKGLDARTFYRKDHLRQHLRLMHGCEMAPAMESWKSTAVNINSRCGFCAQRFTVWQERVDHLTAHFKAGARMSEWKGCRGLDPAVAAQVTNAMPPYLIGIESVSPMPFSASNRTGWRNASANEFSEVVGAQVQDTELDTPSCGQGKSTCWEILTVRLGKYAKEMADKGIVMTDEMLQSRARLILYDSDDPWNQTAADNPEWLDLFKKAHGLNFIPSDIGGQGVQVPEDLETYGDLGLRIPFAVQLAAYNQAQDGPQANDAGTRPGPYQQSREKLYEIYDLLSKECAFYDGDQKCQHAACYDNILNLGPETGNIAKRWCTQEISPTAAHKLLTVMGIGNGHRKSTTPEQGRSRALQTLVDLDCLSHRIHGSCDPPNEVRAAGNARARALNALSMQTSTMCPTDAVQPAMTAAQARAHGLSALARAEAAEVDDCAAVRAARGYLPRYKLKLPQEQARLFATTTGAWEDAGKMPQAVHTSLPGISESTTTGAMMEFLGGNIGSSLPFSNDALTSTIPATDSDWHLPDGGTVSQEEMMNQLNELVTSAGDENFIPGLTAMDLDWTTGEQQPTVAAPADEFNFDDLTFDGVLDMPVDETFGTGMG